MKIPDFYHILSQQGFQFTTDTRNLKQGDIYFALTGANFNGNEFALDAIRSGAAYAVVDDKTLSGKDNCILVDNVLEFMQELARYHRDQLNIPVLAIGGSNGKTTTKELIISVLSTQMSVHGTKGNLNNLIGVPITLLSMPLNTEIAVIEIGTNSFGEIARLCQIVNPDYGIITNIGKEHLEGFGSLEGVAKEESELYLYLLQNNGLVFINLEDDWLMRMAGRIEQQYTYGRTTEADCIVNPIQVMPSIRVECDHTSIHSRLFGEYNLMNIMAAIAIGRYFGISNENIALGIAAYVPSNNRSEIREFGSTKVIMDSYNANPSSAEAAMRSFAQMEEVKKIVILGDMFELGHLAESEHRGIARIASRLNFDQVILVGAFFEQQAGSTGAMGFHTVADCIEYLRTQDLSNTWLLIKGSRGMKMEQILQIWENSPTA